MATIIMDRRLTPFFLERENEVEGLGPFAETDKKHGDLLAVAVSENAPVSIQRVGVVLAQMRERKVTSTTLLLKPACARELADHLMKAAAAAETAGDGYCKQLVMTWDESISSATSSGTLQ